MISFAVNTYGVFVPVELSRCVSLEDCVCFVHTDTVRKNDENHMVALQDANVFRVYMYSTLRQLLHHDMCFHPESRTSFTHGQKTALTCLLTVPLSSLIISTSVLMMEFQQHLQIFKKHQDEMNSYYLTLNLWHTFYGVQSLIFRRRSQRIDLFTLKHNHKLTSQCLNDSDLVLPPCEFPFRPFNFL